MVNFVCNALAPRDKFAIIISMSMVEVARTINKSGHNTTSVRYHLSSRINENHFDHVGQATGSAHKPGYVPGLSNPMRSHRAPATPTTAKA